MQHHTSTSGLVALLADRGLSFENQARAEHVLRRVNYYRFTGYSRHFQTKPRSGDESYVAGTAFEEIMELMRLDDELRMRLFVVISEVELAVRTRFAHIAGRIFGSESFYLDPSNHISDRDETRRRIARIQVDLRGAKQPMVVHYRKGEDVTGIPVWVAIEVLSFGKISWLIESLDNCDLRRQMASFFDVDYRTFPRMLQSLADLRNVCAHHGQIWNRTLVSQCPLPIEKRKRPLHLSYHEHSLYPAIIALRDLAATQQSKTQLRAIERRLVAGNQYAKGVLQPHGVV